MGQELTIVTTKELSRILKLSPYTIYRMISDGRLPPETYIVIGRYPPRRDGDKGYVRRRFILEKVLEALGKEVKDEGTGEA